MQHADLVLLADLPEQHHPVAQFGGHPVQHLLGIGSPSCDEQTQPRPLRAEDFERLEQHGQALTRFVHAAEEADRAAGSRPARQRVGLAVAAGGHAVRDDHGVAADMLDQRVTRGLGHRYPAVDLLHPGAHHRVGDQQHARARDGGMERRDDRAGGHPAGQQGQARDLGLVHVQHVEAAVLDPAPHPAHRQEAERQARHRAVVGHGHRPAGPGDVGRQRRVVVGRRDHRYLVARVDQRLG